MACRLDGTKPSSEPMLEYKLQWNFIQKSNIYIQENALENIVCEMAAICIGLNELKYDFEGRGGKTFARYSSMDTDTHVASELLPMVVFA